MDFVLITAVDVALLLAAVNKIGPEGTLSVDCTVEWLTSWLFSAWLQK